MGKQKLSMASAEPVELDASGNELKKETSAEAPSTSEDTTEATETKESSETKTESKEPAESQKLANSKDTKSKQVAEDDDTENVDLNDDKDGGESSKVSVDKDTATKASPAPEKTISNELSTSNSLKKASMTENSGSTENEGPQRPPRPLSPVSRVKKDLKEAFPQIEDKYIQAVVIASQGQADPAFNALLYLLDPSFVPETIAAPQPPQVPPKNRVSDDELLARQLQKEFEKEDRRRRAASNRRRNVPPPPEEDDESPDEFDQIKETFNQGFEEAKSTISGWMTGFQKKFAQDESAGDNRGQGSKLFGALGGSSFNNTQPSRKFDDDPEILTSDFHNKIDLQDDDKPPRLPKRGAERDTKWQPLNSDVPVNSDAFLVTDLEDEEPGKTKK